MKHIVQITKTPAVGQTTLALKLDSTIEIVDRLLLAQRQAPWKTPFSPGGALEGETTTTTTDTTGTTGIPGA